MLLISYYGPPRTIESHEGCSCLCTCGTGPRQSSESLTSTWSSYGQNGRLRLHDHTGNWCTSGCRLTILASRLRVVYCLASFPKQVEIQWRSIIFVVRDAKAHARDQLEAGDEFGCCCHSWRKIHFANYSPKCNCLIYLVAPRKN